MTKLLIDQPEFRSTDWTATRHNGRPARICTCWELVAGRWEGFVAIEFTDRNGSGDPRRADATYSKRLGPKAGAIVLH